MLVAGYLELLPTREAAAALAERTLNAQWAFWPPTPALAARTRAIVESDFEQLFDATAAGYVPLWLDPGREVLFTWKTAS